MNQSFAKYLKQEVTRLPKFRSAAVYIKRKNTWFDTSSTVVSDKNILSAISKQTQNQRTAKIKDFPHKIAFYLGNQTALVIAPLAASTQNGTIQKHVERLDECFTAAMSSYHAHHDELTGVLNRHGVKHALKEAFNSTIRKSNITKEPDQQTSLKYDVTLFSFDIDKFKSINDTYGHDAGDIVLTSFSAKLAAFSKNLEDDYSAKFIFGRPGGEEFDLIAFGALSKKDRINISERLLVEIRKPLVALESELDKSEKKENSSQLQLQLQLPSIVTASIGIAFDQAPNDIENLLPLYSKLRTDADTAMYRAKTDGRNCARFYNDIVTKHGRVVGYDAHSELVQIDIGSRVGAKRGQVYAIYPPAFSSSSAVHTFVATAKIKIVEVKDDVSTAVLVDRLNNSDVPVGSLLKLLPHGCRIVPIKHEWSVLSLAEPVAKLFDCIDSYLRSDSLGAVIALGGNFRNNDSRNITEKADELIGLLLVALPPKTRIFASNYLSDTFVILDKHAVSKHKDVIDSVNSAITSLSSFGLKCHAGIFDPDKVPESITKSGEAIAFYAKSALISLNKAENNYCVFSGSTGGDTLYYWRQKHSTANALADYRMFRLYGFDSAYLDNQFALALWDDEASEHFTLVEAALSRAASVESNSSVFKANLALFWTEQGLYQKAYHAFKEIQSYVVKEDGLYILAFAKCCHFVEQSVDELGRMTVANILLQATSDENIFIGSKYRGWRQDIKDALKSGAFDEPAPRQSD